jgi:UDP-GlcNAc:undecaprenyl-phosphate GlcNAc-1-phosphate transferase
MIDLITPPLVALLLTLAATPLVRRLAFLCGVTDIPDARRIHKRPTARAGGLGVAIAVAVALAVVQALPVRLDPWVLGGGALLLAVGLIDDVLSIQPHTKLFAQLLAAVLAVVGGLRFPLFGPEATGFLTFVDPVLTVVWIVLITNALNLTDGLDGLASGIGVISFLALTAAALRMGDVSAAVPPLVLAAALLGFLVYNFNPASIFLGDCGSLVIGYAMAVLPLVGFHKGPVPALAAFLLVALPATDTMLAIARRFVSRCLRTWGEGHFLRGLVEGLRNTVAPDRRHIHHRLIDLGFSQRRAVLLLYVGAASTSALAYLVAGSSSWPIDLFALGLGLTVIALIRALGIDELQPARSDLYLPVLHRLARHRWMLVVADGALVAAAYTGALALTGHGAPLVRVAAAAAIMAATTLGSFVVSRVYRTAWFAAGVGGIGQLVQACASGVIAGYALLRLLDLPTHGSTAFVHFLLILPPVTMVRYSYDLVRHAARGAGAERALICGTAMDARQALRRLRRDGLRAIEPIGFIEFRPRLQGRDLARLPVLGTLDALPGIVRERRVTHLVIADPGLPGEALTWVRAVCQQLDVRVHRYVEKLVPYDLLRPAGEAMPANGNGNGNGNANGNGSAVPTPWESPARSADAPTRT